MAITRRRFLAASLLSSGVLAASAAQASTRVLRPGKPGQKLVVATWPNYHSAENLKQFTEQTGIAIELRIFGSNEEMMAHLLTGRSGFDIVVATNYAVNAYGRMGLLRPLRTAHFPSWDEASQQARFLAVVSSERRYFGLPKNWGTTGFVYDRRQFAEPLGSWRQFWDQARGKASRHTVIHDYQLTTIGNALKYFGYSFNSVKPVELDAAEQLLLSSMPHLQAISSLAYDQIRAGAWLSMAWSGDGVLLNRENPNWHYVIAEEGGEIWADYFCITRECEQVSEAEAFIDFLLTPAHNAREVIAHGFPPIDQRVLPLLPEMLRGNVIMFPTDAQLRPLEFGSRETLTHPRRADILAKLKARFAG